MGNEVTILTKEKNVVMPFMVVVLSSDAFVSACLSGIIVKFLLIVLVMQSCLSFIFSASEIAHYGSNQENYLRTGYAGSLFLRRSSSHFRVSGRFINLSVHLEML